MPFPAPQSDAYRLILVCRKTRRILLQRWGTRLCLPRIFVPRWTRAAYQIQRLIRKHWTIDAITLDFLGERPGGDTIVLMESVRQAISLPTQYLWTTLVDLPTADLNPVEQVAVSRLISSGETGRGTFSRLGWIDDALAWIDAVTPHSGLTPRWKVEQFNASATASLIRVSDSNRRAYWFKATGPPGDSEARITRTLASLFSTYLPEVIGFHPHWNAWLMAEEGTALSENTLNRFNLDRVVDRLARLQRESSEHVATLVSSGCQDHRMSMLYVALGEMTPYLEGAVSNQDTQTGPRIRAARIRQIKALVEEATSRFSEMRIPDTLLHGDFSFENILVSRRSCLFTDWAQASVGNPFVTFEHLLLQLRQTEHGKKHLDRAATIYCGNWSNTISATHIRDTLKWLPLVAIASTLRCRRPWLTATGIAQPLSQSYARILARQLDRAAQMIEKDISICA